MRCGSTDRKRPDISGDKCEKRKCAGQKENEHTEYADHAVRVCRITEYLLKNTSLGAHMNEDTIQKISIAAGMHDAGKAEIPDAVLNKPGRLSREEYELVKMHTLRGAEMIQSHSGAMDPETFLYAYDIARHHHERWDGSGYPDGLKENEISEWAQLVSLADAYDALTSRRVYRKAFDPETAVRMIQDGACGSFNPKLLGIFCSAVPLKWNL